MTKKPPRRQMEKMLESDMDQMVKGGMPMKVARIMTNKPPAKRKGK